MRNFIILLFSLFLTSCAALSAEPPTPTPTTTPTTTTTATPVAKSPSQMSADALVKKLGKPNTTSTAANGNKLYVYTTQSYQSYPSSPTFGTPTVVKAGALPIVTAAPPQAPTQNMKVVKCVKTYEIDSNNMVVGVKQQGACK